MSGRVDEIGQDTTTAIAGAISGASLGLDGIPPKRAANLNDPGTWKFTDRVQLAEQCYGVQCKQT